MYIKSFTNKTVEPINIPLEACSKKFSKPPLAEGTDVEESVVELRLKLSEAHWIPDDVKFRLRHNSKYINSDDELVEVSSRYKTQKKNLKE